jgi:hypothetical protein
MNINLYNKMLFLITNKYFITFKNHIIEFIQFIEIHCYIFIL